MKKYSLLLVLLIMLTGCVTSESWMMERSISISIRKDFFQNDKAILSLRMNPEIRWNGFPKRKNHEIKINGKPLMISTTIFGLIPIDYSFKPGDQITVEGNIEIFGEFKATGIIPASFDDRQKISESFLQEFVKGNPLSLEGIIKNSEIYSVIIVPKNTELQSDRNYFELVGLRNKLTLEISDFEKQSKYNKFLESNADEYSLIEDFKLNPAKFSLYINSISEEKIPNFSSTSIIQFQSPKWVNLVN